MQRAISLSLAFLLSGISYAALAQEPGPDTDDEDTISWGDPIREELLVRGTRITTRLWEEGSSVSIITGEDIERRQFTFVRDALITAPGVTLSQNGAFGGTASIRIRGNGSEQTLVLLDGVVVNDPSSPGGGYDFASLDTADIEKIEILRGPQSTLWGSDAIGGVVNITTKRPTEGLSAFGFAEAGSFGTFRAGGSISSAAGPFDFRLSASGITTDGISKADEDDGNSEKDGFESFTTYAKAGVNLGDWSRVEAFGRYVDSETDYDSFGPVTGVQDGDELSETTEWSAGVRARTAFFDGRFRNDVLVSRNSIARDNFTNGAFSFGAEGQRDLFRYQGTMDVTSGQTLAFGAEHEEAEADGVSFGISSLFGLYQATVFETLTLSGGLRLDDHETFGSETTARLAAAWRPVEGLTARASWGEGFKAPTVFQLTFFCCGASAPNRDLQPETSEAFDIGLEYEFPVADLTLQATYFRQETKNLITFAFVDGNYQNIAETRNEGVELGAKARPFEFMELSASYAYLSAEDRSTGAQLIRVPEHSANAEAVFTPLYGLTTSIAARYVGEQGDSFGTIDPYTVVDLRASYDLAGPLQVYGRVDNVFDADYQELFGYGTPGVSAYAGLRARY